MARKSGGQNVDIRITAIDNASPVIGEVGRTFQRMPEQFAKASTAMRLVETAAGQMGGEIAAAAGKVSGLASLMATGGPIGIGIAAVTAAVTAGALAWKIYRQEAEEATKIGDAIKAQLEKAKEPLEKQRERIEKLRQQLSTFGMSEAQIKEGEVDRLAANTEKSAERINALKEQRLGIERQIAQEVIQFGDRFAKRYETELATIDQTLMIEKETLETNKIKLAQTREEIDLLKEHQFLEEDKRKADDEEKERAQRRSEMARKKKQEQKEEAENERKLAKIRQEAAQDYLLITRKHRDEMTEQRGREQAEREKADEAWLRKEMENNRRKEEEEKERIKKIRDTYKGIARTITGEMEGAIESVATGQKTIEKAAVEMLGSLARTAARALVNTLVDKAVDAVVDAVMQTTKVVTLGAVVAANKTADVAEAESAIGAASAEATAKSLAAYAGIPFVGPALGAAQAASMVAAIQASRAFLLAEEGLLIRGGRSGIDSVPVMGQAGEGVLTVKQTAAVIKLADRLDRLERRGQQPTQGGRAMAVSFQSLIPPSSADAMRAVRKMHQMQKRLIARGY